MTVRESFDSTKRPLQELLKEIYDGKLQLPDFQRGWVWDDDRIKSLLASVGAWFPIGALMFLETRGEGIRFKPRPVEGTRDSLLNVPPETWILDGQQRLTSLYQALLGEKPADSRDAKGKPIKRWYYISMEAAVGPEADLEEAVISVPEDRQVKTFGGEIALDLSSRELEYKNKYFPAMEIFDSAEWRAGYSQYWDYDRKMQRLFDDFEREVIKTFERYLVPVIKLTKETPKEAVCLVFEKVNTGGVSLTVFELLTASFAAENFQLRDDWNHRERKLKTHHPVLHTLQSDDFLQAICLLVTQKRRRDAIAAGTPPERAPGISCKRRDILRLTVKDYEEWAGPVEEGFRKAARFLHHQKIFRATDLPYRTQLVPLAAIEVDLGPESETDGARQKTAQWYWCGVLGELYGGATETRFARDLPEVVEYVERKGGPVTVTEADFQAGRLLTLRTRNSAAYKGIYALLMRGGCCDFRTGEPIEDQTFFDDKIDIHHIFPKKWCDKAPIEAACHNSIINKTAIAVRTNRKIGGRAPSRYLETLEKDAGISGDRMDRILQSHQIEPHLLRNDDFWGFFAKRAEALLSRIEAAMEKSILRRPELFKAGATIEEYVEEPVEWEAEEGASEQGTPS
ncbi:MAG: DUF262 domain-containing protein [Candidatus Eisenbacteria bacterium]|nr:DUF262 domain-containing protein [Candidatus Eisenbacteria bacterium]